MTLQSWWVLSFIFITTPQIQWIYPVFLETIFRAKDFFSGLKRTHHNFCFLKCGLMGEMKVAWCQWGTLQSKCEIWASRLMQPRPQLQFCIPFQLPKQVVCWCWGGAYVSGIRLTVLQLFMSTENETVDCVTWERRWGYWYFHTEMHSPPSTLVLRKKTKTFIQSPYCLTDTIVVQYQSIIMSSTNSSEEMNWNTAWDFRLKSEVFVFTTSCKIMTE